MKLSLRSLAQALCLTAAFVSPKTGHADAVENFYKGRVVSVVIAYSAGGGYDVYARLLSKYLGKHIPGNPTLVPVNMPGAGTLKATKYLYSVAPKDGSVIGIFSRSIPLSPLLGLDGANFDATKFTWLGSITSDTVTCISWKTSQVKSWQDALTKTFRVGGEGRSSDPDLYANLVKNELQAKASLVTGYPGTADIVLAMERGELDGLCGISYSTLTGAHSGWLENHDINILVQGALEKDPNLPNVPMMLDLAKSDEQKKILRLVLASQVMARPFVAPPGVPAARAAALRKAFDQTVHDPEFLAEAAKLRLEVKPKTGSDIEKLLVELYATPKPIAAAAAHAVGF